MSLFIVQLLSLVSYAFAQEPTTVGDMYATMDTAIESIFQSQFLPPGYELPRNIYDWNVTELVILIQTKDPDILYTIETSLLFTIFPEIIIQQLPRDVLITHKLYYLLPMDDPARCTNITNCTTALHQTAPPISKIDPCYGPFVHTKYDGVFTFPNGSRTFQCAMRCEHTKVMWNVTDDELHLIDALFWFFSVSFLVLVFLHGINICMDVRFGKHGCCDRNFLFHAPIFIGVLYAAVAFSFLFPLIIGKDNVACDDDLDGIKTFGSYNPGGSSVCTVMGIWFYSTMMLVGGYTAFYSMSLWSEFYAPLNSIWIELKNKAYCKCCCDLADRISNRFPSVMDSTDYIPHFQGKYSRLLCSKDAFKHYIIWLIALIYTVVGVNERLIQAAPVLGLCTIGTRGRQSTVIYSLIPHTIFLVLSFLFFPVAIVLLIRVAQHGNKESKSTFKQLKWRLLVYFVSILIGWSVVVMVYGFVFHLERPRFEAAAELRTKCMMIKSGTGGSYDDCMDGFTYWYGWYILCGVTFPCCGIGALVLSCNKSNWVRWTILFRAIVSAITCNKDENILMRLSNAVEMRSDVVGSKSSATSATKGSKGSKADTAAGGIHLRVDSMMSASDNSTPETPTAAGKVSPVPKSNDDLETNVGSETAPS